jgi:Tfp pilus assembly protein PilF
MVGAAVVLAVAVLGSLVVWYYAWPGEQLAAAAQALRQHDYVNARSRLDRYLLRWPDDNKALLLAARAAWQSGDYAESERFIGEHERRAGPTDSGRLEWALIGACQGDWGGDEAWLRSLAETADTSAPLEALARGYQRAFRWQDAQQALNQLIDREPAYAAPYLQRGTIRRRLGGPYEANRTEKEFRHAAALAPESSAAHLALAGALMDQGMIHEAMEQYEFVLNAEPSDAAALLGLARALTDGAQLAEAARCLDALLAAQPDHADALVERGRLALRRGQAAAAEGFLARAVRAAPWHRAGHRLYLSALKELGRNEAAAKCEARVNELVAEDAAGARLQLRMQNAPDDVPTQWELYQWYVRNGDAENGFARLMGILRLDPRHGPAQAAAADHFENAGQPRRAAQHRALASRVQPSEVR